MEVRGSLCARRVSAVRSHQVTSDWKRPFIFKQSFWEGEISPVGHFKQLNATAKFLLGFAPKETLEVTAAVARRPWAGPASPVAGSRGVLESSPTHHSFCSLSLYGHPSPIVMAPIRVPRGRDSKWPHPLGPVDNLPRG